MKTGNPRMINESTTVTIQNRICHIYRYGKTEINTHRIPVFYWGTGAAGRESVQNRCRLAVLSSRHMNPKTGTMISHRGKRRQSLAGKISAERRGPHWGGLCSTISRMSRQKHPKLPVFRSDIHWQGFLVCGYTVSVICLQARSAVPVPCGMRDGLIMSEKRGQRCAGTARDTSI